MKTPSFSKIVIVLSLVLLVHSGCTKQDQFLDAKPDEALSVPATVNDLWLLIKNDGLFSSNYPELGIVSADEYYVTPDVWVTAASATERNAYTWAPLPFYDINTDISDWSWPYKEVYTANTVLDALPKLTVTAGQQNLYNQVKGSALFFRANAFYNLLQLFAPPYDSTTAGTQSGIPLRLTADLNLPSVRSSEKQCYDQVLSDVKTAVTLLPAKTTYVTLPASYAAQALLARICLSMGVYQDAFQYADACLQAKPDLFDYNTRIANSSARKFASTTQYPLTEDIFHAATGNYGICGYTKAIVDSALYQSYAPEDLRKAAFFSVYNGQPRFCGSYEFNKSGQLFCGLATDEIYLIRAECNARMGHTTAAMEDVNTLLINRYTKGRFTPHTATSPDDALSQVLTERKKELVGRGTRWTDLRRLNKESRWAVTLTRSLNGVPYLLPPNDLRYTLPIPDNEIQLSGIPQNPR